MLEWKIFLALHIKSSWENIQINKMWLFLYILIKKKQALNEFRTIQTNQSERKKNSHQLHFRFVTFYLLLHPVVFIPFQDSTGSFVLPFRQVLYSPYPTTHIDVDINTVKQMPPCHEHTYNQRRYMRLELSTLWKTDSEENIPLDTIIYTDETFTPDLWGHVSLTEL